MSLRPARSTLFPYTTLFRSALWDVVLSVKRDASVPRGGRRDEVGWLGAPPSPLGRGSRSEEHTSELQSRVDLVCRLLLEKKNETVPTERILAEQRNHGGMDG